MRPRPPVDVYDHPAGLLIAVPLQQRVDIQCAGVVGEEVVEVVVRHWSAGGVWAAGSEPEAAAEGWGGVDGSGEGAGDEVGGEELGGGAVEEDGFEEFGGGEDGVGGGHGLVCTDAGGWVLRGRWWCANRFECVLGLEACERLYC